MSSDLAQLNLAEPGKTDWDNYGKSGWQAPPPAKGPDGKYIIYSGVAKGVSLEEAYPEKGQNETGEEQSFLTVRLDDLTIADPGKYQGYEIKFAQAGRRPYTKLIDGKRVPKKGLPSRLGDYLRAAGSVAKPQTNAEYLAAAKQAAGRKFSFTLEWEARNKDTGEVIKGYDAFPDDPLGGKKAILKEGDFYNELGPDGKVIGQKKVQSQVIFANAKLRFFVDAAPKVGGR
jgi:hypothetical protein